MACDFDDFWRRLSVMHQPVLPPHPGTHTPRPAAPTRWSSIPRIAYTGLLAFVFPFICRGRTGQAGHSHALPHFVFAHAKLPGGIDAGPHADLSPLSSHGSFGVPEDDRPRPTAQTLPDSLLLFLLLLASAETTCRLHGPVRRSLFTHWEIGRLGIHTGLGTSSDEN